MIIKNKSSFILGASLSSLLYSAITIPIQLHENHLLRQAIKDGADLIHSSQRLVDSNRKLSKECGIKFSYPFFYDKKDYDHDGRTKGIQSKSR